LKPSCFAGGPILALLLAVLLAMAPVVAAVVAVVVAVVKALEVVVVEAAVRCWLPVSLPSSPGGDWYCSI
jgi:hypothetical protein